MSLFQRGVERVYGVLERFYITRIIAKITHSHEGGVAGRAQPGEFYHEARVSLGIIWIIN